MLKKLMLAFVILFYLGLFVAFNMSYPVTVANYTHVALSYFGYANKLVSSEYSAASESFILETDLRDAATYYIVSEYYGHDVDIYGYHCTEAFDFEGQASSWSGLNAIDRCPNHQIFEVNSVVSVYGETPIRVDFNYFSSGEKLRTSIESVAPFYLVYRGKPFNFDVTILVAAFLFGCIVFWVIADIVLFVLFAYLIFLEIRSYWAAQTESK